MGQQLAVGSQTPISFGRQLVDGDPIGDGITLTADGPTAALISDLSGPIISNPVTEEYVGVLLRPEEVDAEYGQILEFFPPGNMGPPEHYHPAYEERFEVIEGEYVFVVDGEQRTLMATHLFTASGRASATTLRGRLASRPRRSETAPPSRPPYKNQDQKTADFAAFGRASPPVLPFAFGSRELRRLRQ